MRFIHTLLVAGTAAAALAGAGPAIAADLPVTPLVTSLWTGWYVGLNAGGVWGQTAPGFNVDDSLGRYYTFGAGQAANVAAVQAAGSSRFSNSGFTGGGQIGYNIQAGALVYGIEADFEYFNPKRSVTINGALPALGPPFTITNSSSGDWLTTFRGRVGFAQNNWLFYGTAGLAVAQLKFASTYADQTTSPPQVSAALQSNFSSTKTVLGVALGAGAEVALSRNWSLRAEYLYLGFGGIQGTTTARPTVGAVPGNGVCPPSSAAGFCSTFNYDAAMSEHVVRFAVNYKWM